MGSLVGGHDLLLVRFEHVIPVVAGVREASQVAAHGVNHLHHVLWVERHLEPVDLSVHSMKVNNLVTPQPQVLPLLSPVKAIFQL